MKRMKSLISIACLVLFFSCDQAENDHPHIAGEGHVHDDEVGNPLSGETVQPLFGKFVLPHEEDGHTQYSVVTFVNPKRLKFKASDGHTKDKTHRHILYEVLEFPVYDSLGNVTETKYIYELIKFKK